MDENLANEKLDILKWIEDLQDENIIEDLLKLKKWSEEKTSVNESKKEYTVTNDFEERWSKGIPHDEMKNRSREFIRNLPWEK